MKYTLDKLVVYLRVRSLIVDKIVKVWNSGSDELCSVVKFWIGHSPAVCSQNYTCKRVPAILSIWVLVFMAPLPSDFGRLVKLEFNPAKVGSCHWFCALYNLLIAGSKYVDFKRFDVAIDLPVARSRLQLLKDQRKYSLLEYSAENKTEYLGVRSAHGNCKLYNKALEQKLKDDLTRLEVTVDYANSSWQEFQRIFPVCRYVGSGVPPDSLKDTDLVLFLACADHPEYLRMLGRSKRKN